MTELMSHDHLAGWACKLCGHPGELVQLRASAPEDMQRSVSTALDHVREAHPDVAIPGAVIEPFVYRT